MDTSSEHIVVADYVDGNLSGPARAAAAGSAQSETGPSPPEMKPRHEPVRVLLPRFANRIVEILILSSLFPAEALRKHGLTRRLALVTIVATGGE